MKTRVRDIPPGVKFSLTRNGNKFTMIGQHEELRYLFRVVAHDRFDRKGKFFNEHVGTLNGQSFSKPVVRCA